jgi:hypothetical protein
MMLTVLRTVFLTYVRVLLCLQSLFVGFWAWNFWPVHGSRTDLWALDALTLLLTCLALAGIVTAVLLRRGRRWAAVNAILVEALWAATAAALALKTLKDWPLDWPLAWHLTVLAAVFFVAFAGLLLRPVRAYTGLVRRRAPEMQVSLPGT